MITISFSAKKGGIGKTTSAHNVGAGLARMGEKVLLVDLDPQSNLTTACGVDYTELKKSIGTLLLEQSKFGDTVIKLNGYDLLPASADLSGQEDSLKASPEFPFNLRAILDSQAKTYDVVVLDTPPAAGGMTRMALVASHFYFVPLEAEFLSYEGLRTFVEFANKVSTISGRSLLGGVFATRYNPNVRKRLSNDLVAQVEEQLGKHFIPVNIRENIALSEAQAMGQDIFSYAPESKAAEDYQNLCNYILSVISK